MPEPEPKLPAEFEELKTKGWDVEFVKDPAGEVYSPHKHEETKLHTISGDVQIRVSDSDSIMGDWQSVPVGQTFTVLEGQIHEAIVGDEGWSYWAASDPEAAKSWNH